MVTQEVADAVVILVVGFIVIQGIWLSVLTYQMLGRSLRNQREKEEASGSKAYLEEVFLLHRSGVLLRHLTRRLKPFVDSDIISGMLRAVQEFVRDTFRGERGELKEMTFGELKISLCTGQYAVLATVMRGDPPVDIIEQMHGALTDLERDHGDALADWNGVVEEIPFVDGYLTKLLEGDYEDGPGPKDEGEGEKWTKQLKRRLVALPSRRNSR